MADARSVRMIDIEAATWHRVHAFDPATGKFGPTAFNDSGRGNARFSPLLDPATGAVIPTMYVAGHVRGAIAEVLLHDIPEPSTGFNYDWERDRTGNLCMSTIGLPGLKLANLTSTGLRAAGMSDAGLFQFAASTYPTTRALALAIWEQLPDVQGICWMSVRDNQSKALMLFGDRIDASVFTIIGGPSRIREYQEIVFGLLDELGCGLAP